MLNETVCKVLTSWFQHNEPITLMLLFFLVSILYILINAINACYMTPNKSVYLVHDWRMQKYMVEFKVLDAAGWSNADFCQVLPETKRTSRGLQVCQSDPWNAQLTGFIGEDYNFSHSRPILSMKKTVRRFLSTTHINENHVTQECRYPYPPLPAQSLYVNLGSHYNGCTISPWARPWKLRNWYHLGWQMLSWFFL